MLSPSKGVRSNAGHIPSIKRKVTRSLALGPALYLERIAALVAFTSQSLRSPRPRPFGASIVHTKSGKLRLRALNNVAHEFDQSTHAEVRAIRLATKRLKKLPLVRYTLYTT